VKNAVLLVAAVMGAGCSSFVHDASRRPWSIEGFPSPNLPEAIVEKLVSAPKHGLSFEYNPRDWTFSDVEKTNDQLNSTEISFLFNRVPIGVGDQGLANLRLVLSRLPRETPVLTVHCLDCQTNRWSERIRRIEEELRASNGVRVRCDGAF